MRQGHSSWLRGHAYRIFEDLQFVAAVKCTILNATFDFNDVNLSIGFSAKYIFVLRDASKVNLEMIPQDLELATLAKVKWTAETQELDL